MQENIALIEKKYKTKVTIDDIQLFRVILAPTREGLIIKFPLEGVKAHHTIFIKDRMVNVHIKDEEKNIYPYKKEFPLDYLLSKFYRLLAKAIHPRNIMKPSHKEVLVFRSPLMQFFTLMINEKNEGDKGYVELDLISFVKGWSGDSEYDDRYFDIVRMDELYKQPLPVGIGRVKGRKRIIIAFTKEIVLCMPLSLFMKKIPNLFINTFELKRYMKYIKPQIKAYRKALKEKQDLIDSKFDILEE